MSFQLCNRSICLQSRQCRCKKGLAELPNRLSSKERDPYFEQSAWIQSAWSQMILRWFDQIATASTGLVMTQFGISARSPPWSPPLGPHVTPGRWSSQKPHGTHGSCLVYEVSNFIVKFYVLEFFRTKAHSCKL